MRNLRKIFLPLFLLFGCIGTDVLDDFVPAEIVITNEISTIQIGTEYTFNAVYRNNTGIEEEIPLLWNSSDQGIISIDNSGKAQGLNAGESTISVSGEGVEYSFILTAGDSTSGPVTERSAQLRTVSSYPMSGSVTLAAEDDRLVLRFADNFNTTSALPGLYIYLTNNPSSTSNALEIGKVTSFSGAQNYAVPGDAGLFDYKYVLLFCKPFVVPVGNGELMP